MHHRFNPLLPNPGSHMAFRAGCTCNMIVNQFGLGDDLSGATRHWIIDPGCIMHTELADQLVAHQKRKEMAGL